MTMIDYGAVAPAVDVRTPLQAVECVDALGQRSADADSDMDATTT
jgi:hypothetical protein